MPLPRSPQRRLPYPLDLALLGGKIRARMADEHLSIAAAAAAAGVDRSALYRLARGHDWPHSRQRPGIDAVAKVTAWLGMRLADLELTPPPPRTTLPEVEQAILALPLPEDERERLAAIVRSGFESSWTRPDSQLLKVPA